MVINIRATWKFNVKYGRYLKGLDPKKTALARASSICKRQTRPLVREDAPQK
jgi:hypothetical protein